MDFVNNNKVDISNINLEPGERVDNIGFNDLMLIQKPDEFCYGVDAVLLADFAAKGQTKHNHFCKIMDLGTGTGIIPIILSHKTDAMEIWGVEVQNDSFERGLRNIKINSLEKRLFFINDDVSSLCEDKGFHGMFDAVTSNPPYTIGNCGLTNRNSAKQVARHETTASLDDFVKCSSRFLKDKGHLFMVHRPSRLVDICCSFRNNGIEPKELRFVSGKIGEKPNIILVHGIKNGGRELKILDPLAIYEEKGKYSEEILKIYEKISH